jgi:hypothetical protein
LDDLCVGHVGPYRPRHQRQRKDNKNFFQFHSKMSLLRMAKPK